MVEIDPEKLTDKFFFCDPSGGKQKVKATRARSAIVGVAPYDIWIVVLFAWASRAPTSKLIDKIFEVCETWHPKLFGVESNAMQSLFADSLRYKAKLEHKRYPIVGIAQSTKVDKTFRIRSTLQPIVGFRRLILAPGAIELRSEMTSFPMGQTVDLVDCLASACAMVPARSTRAERSHELDARLDYLRRSGAEPSYIREVAEGSR